MHSVTYSGEETKIISSKKVFEEFYSIMLVLNEEKAALYKELYNDLESGSMEFSKERDGIFIGYSYLAVFPRKLLIDSIDLSVAAIEGFSDNLEVQIGDEILSLIQLWKKSNKENVSDAYLVAVFRYISIGKTSLETAIFLKGIK